jgi:hypothetical protein
LYDENNHLIVDQNAEQQLSLASADFVKTYKKLKGGMLSFDWNTSLRTEFKILQNKHRIKSGATAGFRIDYSSLSLEEAKKAENDTYGCDELFFLTLKTKRLKKTMDKLGININTPDLDVSDAPSEEMVFPMIKDAYLHKLRIYVHAVATHPQVDNEAVPLPVHQAKFYLDELIKQGASCDINLPKPETTLDELVEMGVQLELSGRAHLTEEECIQKNQEWDLILNFASIKYGPNALLRTFQSKLSEAESAYSQVRKPYLNALQSGLLIVAGVAIIAAGIAAAVVSYGTLAPALVLTLKIGLPLIAAGLGISAIVIGKKQSKLLNHRKNFQRKMEGYLPFCKDKENANNDRMELPRAIVKSFG